MLEFCSKCKKEIDCDLTPGINKPVLTLYYDEKTYEIVCKECYEKEKELDAFVLVDNGFCPVCKEGMGDFKPYCMDCSITWNFEMIQNFQENEDYFLDLYKKDE